MLIITCPHCGARAQTEFTYHGDATRTRPGQGAPEEAWLDYVFNRSNVRGGHVEHWQHSQGCRVWLAVERDTLTHEITSVKPAKKTD